MRCHRYVPAQLGSSLSNCPIVFWPVSSGVLSLWNQDASSDGGVVFIIGEAHAVMMILLAMVVLKQHEDGDAHVRLRLASSLLS